MWGRVLWTSEAAEAVARRRFRYLSPVIRFDAPDRVTGEPVAMMVHSVALTNTPFFTELTSLNHNPATEGGALAAATAKGGESMSVLESVAAALGREPEQVASELGLSAEEAANDAQAAGAVLANAARVRELEESHRELEARAARAGAVANALGLPPEAEEASLRAAILRLKAPHAGLGAVRARLDLPPEASEQEILNSIGTLREARSRGEAEDVVEAAVRDGRIPPAHRDFYLREALNDLEAARVVINSLPVLTAPRGRSAVPSARPSGRQLSDAERSVCRQLGVSAEQFLNAAG
jgi:phage I-like protein